jgi:hypothetical protein
MMVTTKIDAADSAVYGALLRSAVPMSVAQLSKVTGFPAHTIVIAMKSSPRYVVAHREGQIRFFKVKVR